MIKRVKFYTKLATSTAKSMHEKVDYSLMLCMGATVSTTYALHSHLAGNSLDFLTALIWAMSLTCMIVPALLDFDMDHEVLLIRQVLFGVMLGVLYLLLSFEVSLAVSLAVLFIWRIADVALSWVNWYRCK